MPHSSDGPEIFRVISRLYMGLGTSAVALLTLISPYLLQLFTAPAYHQAWPIVSILAWQTLFYGFFLIATLASGSLKNVFEHILDFSCCLAWYFYELAYGPSLWCHWGSIGNCAHLFSMDYGFYVC